MSKRFIFHIVLIIVFFLLEVTIVKLLFPPTICLRLLLLVGLSLLFLDYQEESFWWLIGGGILLDLQSSQIFGLHTFFLLAVYIAISIFCQRVIHQPNLFLLAGLVALSVLFYDLIQWLALVDQGSWLFLLEVFGWSALINFIAIWPIYLFAFYLSGWLAPFQLFQKKEQLDVE